MRWLGYKGVNLKSISTNVADIRKRMKAPHVIELAADIKAAGEEPIHAPTIRAKDKRLLCGRDRVAAAMINEASRIWVHVADCDDKEAKGLELRENIYRRPVSNRAEMLTELVALTEQRIRADLEAGTVSTLQPGASEQTIKAAAHKEVARAAGVKVATVKKAARRVHDESDGAGSPVSAAKKQPGATAPSEPCIDLLGVPLADVEASLPIVAAEQAKYDEADKYLRQAVRVLGQLEDEAQRSDLVAQVQRVGSLVRSGRPALICPWCKWLPALQDKCPGCRSFGYVSKERAKTAPPECTDTSRGPVVVMDGVFRIYADVRDGKWDKHKNGKSIAVTTTDGKTRSGRELTVERDDEDVPF